MLSSLQTRLESTIAEMETKEEALAVRLADTEKKLKRQEKLVRNIEAAKARKARKKQARSKKGKKH